MRVAAALVDVAICLALFPVVGVATGWSGAGDGRTTTVLVVYVALVFLYFMVLESTLARTVGKLLLGLQVVGWRGDRPSVVAIAIRTILRVVDWLPMLYLVGFISMILTGARRKRLGDLVAETTVERTSPVRHRGIYATLLAIALFGVVAVSALSAASTGLLSETSSSSSACVFDRCNATARGDQVMDMFDRVVAISDVAGGSGSDARATFTVAGDVVTLRVGEARQVGPTLVHLASVEGDVAKFSVDFSGLFVNRADLRGAADGQRSTYASYTEVVDDQGVVTVELPAAWDDIDGREDPEYGPSIHAAPDLEDFARRWDAPGITVDVSTRHGAEDSSTVLDQIAPSDQCTSAGREDYGDRRHRGEIERWTACDGAATTVVTVAVAPPGGGYLVRVLGQAVEARDLAALDRALATVEVSAAPSVAESSAPAGPTAAVATTAEWVRTVETLRTEIENAIDDMEDELTAPVLSDMARAMRRCSRTLATAPSDAGLRRLQERVETACAEYDRGADCLVSAAEIGTPQAGSAEDKMMTDALDCGFAALNRGGDLLVDAEIEAKDLQAAKPR